MPRVSIVSPVYNGAQFLNETVEAVRAQTEPDWEYVIVDDGSADGSALIASRAAAADRRVRMLTQPNQGALVARRRGFAETGPSVPYVLFLDADDVLEPPMLAEMVAYLDEHPQVGMAFCEPIWMHADGSPAVYGSPGERFLPTWWGARRLRPGQPDTPFEALFGWGRVNVSISLVRRDAYDAAGGFDVAQGFHGEDLDLWLKIALRRPIHYVPRRLVRRRLHPTSFGQQVADSDAQDLRLYRRWLAADWLTDGEQARVRRAWARRQGRLLPYLWLRWGSGHLREGHPAHALRCYARAARRLATATAATARGQLPAGPAW